MGLLGNLGKSLSSSKEMDVDAFMSAAEAEHVDVMHEKADAYVKPIALSHDSDLKIVEDELSHGNIVLLNITAYARNPARLKEAVSKLRAWSMANNGDVARIEEDKLLLTPKNVKIVKKARH